MPAKKKEVKQEEHVYVDEEGTFIHQAEGARYSGGTRRFNSSADSSAAATITPSKTLGHKANANNNYSSNSGAHGQHASDSAAGASTHNSIAGSATQRGNAAAAESSAAAATHVLRYRHGHGVYTSPTLHYVGQWVEDCMHGVGTLRFKQSGSTYTGDFVRGMFDGEGEYVWRDGSRYVGSWRANRMHGVGTYTDADGNVWKGKFYNGTGPGLQKLYQEASLSCSHPLPTYV